MKLQKELMKEKRKLEELITLTARKTRKVPSEQYSVKVLVHHNSLQFYKKNSSHSGGYHYLHASEKEKAKNIVKYNYFSKANKYAMDELKLINRLLNKMNNNSYELLYKRIGQGKRRIIDSYLFEDTNPSDPDSYNSAIITDEQYKKLWTSEVYTRKEIDDDTPEIFTENGERVRSKSEKIIADKLFKEGIPYRYEYPLYIPDIGIFYPDFTLLDIANRRNIILEHFGLMNNEKYADNAVSKIQILSSMGYKLGDNLFITMETSQHPFDSRMLDGLINTLK
ncbi:MAG: hypothetical protein K6G88_09965 [Lachnospiraceae bacterium]|nr:hypothetical protein [Lachnospiraceae bacterium]